MVGQKKRLSQNVTNAHTHTLSIMFCPLRSVRVSRVELEVGWCNAEVKPGALFSFFILVPKERGGSRTVLVA